MAKRLTQAGLIKKHAKEMDEMRRTYEIKIEGLGIAHKEELANEKRQTYVEQQTRKAAQRGLVPYVSAIQALNRWLEGEPDLARQLEPALHSLGLWGVKVGYDPAYDVELYRNNPAFTGKAP